MKLRIAETASVETAELPDLGRQPATTCASAHHTTTDDDDIAAQERAGEVDVARARLDCD